MNVRLFALGDVPPGLSTAVLEALPPPYAAGEHLPGPVDPAACYDRQRAQVDAVCVLQGLPTPEDGWVTMGLTGVDLFIPALSYVFGLSHLGGRRGLVSWFRLRPDPGERDAAALLLRRLTVEVVHELGHALGLVHCPVGECPMHRSLWPEGVDLKQPDYCPSCLASLAAALEQR